MSNNPSLEGDSLRAYQREQSIRNASQAGTCSARLDEEIARGGMGAIYKGTDSDLDRTIAVKVALDESKPEQFFEEARVTALLEHSNIVPIHDAGHLSDGRSFFSMKLVQGQTLKELLDKRKESLIETPLQSLNRLLDIFLKICDGMAYAHSRRVVHRDLKPENIMVGDYGEVLVMDWGIAQVKGQFMGEGTPILASQWTTTMNDGEISGTPCYMAPEQAAGEKNAIGPRTDVYGLGAILYEILTGLPPIDAVESDTLIRVLRKVMDNDILPPERRTPKQFIPRELSAVTMKALNSEAADRYRSVEDLQGDIRLYLAGHSVSAISDSYFQLMSKLIRRNKALLMTFLVLIGCLGAAALFGALRVVNEKDQALLAKEKASDELKSLQERERETKNALKALADTEAKRRRSQQERVEFQEVSRKLNDLTVKSLIPGPDRDALLGEYDQLLGSARRVKTKRIIQVEKAKTLIRFQRLLAARKMFQLLKVESPGAESTWDLQLKLKLAELTNVSKSFLKFLDRYAKKFPKSAVALYLNAYRSDDRGLQLLALNKAIQKDSRLPIAYVYRAGIYLQERRETEKAVDDCNRAILVSPSFFYAYIHRGRAFRRLKRFDEAFEEFEHALIIADISRVRREIGSLYMETKLPRQAMPYLIKAVSLNEKDLLAYQLLIRCAFLCEDSQRFNYLKRFESQFPEAAEQLKSELGVSLDQETIEATFQKLMGQAGKAKIERKYQTALDYLKKAEQLKPGSARVGIGLLEIYVKARQFDKAEALGERLVKKYPSRWEPCYFYMETLVNQQRFLRVLEFFPRAEKSAPSDQVREEMKCYKASALIGLKRYEDALISLNQIPESSKSYSLVLYLYGLTYRRMKLHNKALKNLRRSWEMGYFLALVKALDILKDLKNEKEWKAELGKALRVYPQWRSSLKRRFGVLPQ
ncbi:MAG: protein kinase [Planctomycetota bacterium]|nr:protein kinase [Planctomycetota bacterium]